MNNGSQKQYTFINMKRCVGKNGRPYIGVTLEALVSRPDSEIFRTENGRGVIHFSTPIHNRSKYIGEMCGLEPYTGQDGASWARVAMWDSDPERAGLATRFKNLMDKHAGKTVILLITGSIRVSDDPGRDGKTYRNVNIACDDYTALRVLEPKGNNDRDRGTAAPQQGSQSMDQSQHSQRQTAANNAPSQYGQQQGWAGQGWQGGYDDEQLPF